jgi:hypothetical protein
LLRPRHVAGAHDRKATKRSARAPSAEERSALDAIVVVGVPQILELANGRRTLAGEFT